ncbi:MAG: hypothetical protein EAZ44_06635 [Cytophagia bacterium]|nr:MAG: hypothetical protein EAZ44_06635 [Cytophagia bacterium]TAG42084.1 MAG: hypothetical protein EAZ31_06820 [Cytophagia bacterium]
MKTISFFYFVFFFPFFVLAQSNNDNEENDKSLAIYGIGTVQMTQFNNFNTILQANNYGTMSNTNLNIGGGIMLRNNEILVQGEFRMYKNEVKNTTSNAIMNVNLFQLNVGYTLFNREKIKISPLLGAGVANATLNVAPMTNTTSNLGGILTNPTGFGKISATQFSLHAAVQVEILPVYLNLRGGRKARGLIGIKSGYYLPLQDVTWKIGSTSITGSGGTPINENVNMNFGGFYVSLMAGIDLIKK